MERGSVSVTCSRRTPGAIGFEAIGEVEDDDWEKQVEPVLGSEMARNQKIRLIYLLGPEAREVEGDAMTADTGFRARFATSFDRVAVVSDETWMRPAMRALSFLLPGRGEGVPGRRAGGREGLGGRKRHLDATSTTSSRSGVTTT
jgi:hypothetical protein